MYQNIKNPFGGELIHLVEIDSTMNYAKKIISEKKSSGTVIIADFQKQGRGRIPGRVWNSDLGSSLLFSIILPQALYTGSFPLSLKIGYILASFFNNKYKSSIDIKWPNDLLVNSKKLSGILIESDTEQWIVGIGININKKSWGELEKPAISIEELSDTVINKEQLFSEIINSLYNNLNSDTSDRAWSLRVTNLLYSKNKTVDVLLGNPLDNKIISGTLESICKDGSLVLIESGINIRRNIYSGEIIYQ